MIADEWLQEIRANTVNYDYGLADQLHIAYQLKTNANTYLPKVRELTVSVQILYSLMRLN